MKRLCQPPDAAIRGFFAGLSNFSVCCFFAGLTFAGLPFAGLTFETAGCDFLSGGLSFVTAAVLTFLSGLGPPGVASDRFLLPDSSFLLSDSSFQVRPERLIKPEVTSGGCCCACGGGGGGGCGVDGDGDGGAATGESAVDVSDSNWRKISWVPRGVSRLLPAISLLMVSCLK